jgi:hypothetical protein
MRPDVLVLSLSLNVDGVLTMSLHNPWTAVSCGIVKAILLSIGTSRHHRFTAFPSIFRFSEPLFLQEETDSPRATLMALRNAAYKFLLTVVQDPSFTTYFVFSFLKRLTTQVHVLVLFASLKDG